jgi:hypothetical protein
VGKPDRIARQLKGSLMPKLVYRVVSACGALGYGYPKESLYAALRGRVDALICDGGSTDAGPYYLGTGTDYFERDAIKVSYRHMAAVGKQFGCPVILGSSGMAGANRNLDRIIDIAKEVFAELDIRAAKVAVIRSELDPELVIDEYRKGALRATGFGPEPTEDALRESVIVGQMGIHPLITALESGAQFILAGRSCDAALFASNMVRRGIDPGLAYHVGHVLESGALAWSPKSMTTALRCSRRRIRRAAARPIQSRHIRSMNGAIRSSNPIPRVFLFWRTRGSSLRTVARPASATAASSVQASHGVSSSRVPGVSAHARSR